MNNHFRHAQKHVPKEYGMTIIHNLSGYKKIIWMQELLWLEIIEGSFHVTLCNF